MPFIPVLLPVIPPLPTVFNQSIAAFRARQSFSVAIGLDASMNKTSASNRYKLAFEAPNKVLLTRLVDGKPSVIFWFEGQRFVAYDPIGGEMVVRKTLGTRIVDRVANAVGNLDDPIAAQLSPDAMGMFLNRFRSVSGWSSSSSPSQITLVHVGIVKGKRTRAEFDFAASSKLLTKVLLEGPGSRLLWTFDYGPKPRKLSFSPPPGTRKVASLSEHIHIDASDAGTRVLIDRSLRAYARLGSIAYSVNGPDGPSDNWMDGSSYRERQSKVDWSYRNGVFTVRDNVRRSAYRGRCKRGDVLTYLKALKYPTDPTMLALLGHRNPIRGWFLPGMKVVAKGTVSLHGVASSAVELRSEGLEVSVLIRRDNYLVASVASRTTNGAGGTVFEADRDFHYWSVNRALAASCFVVAASKFLPLSAIGRR